mmetsp:Transcript_43528/g.44213  ORF Transcript_43528/g.44213 Transcript_43528/m.44213 type:complete len:91 (+) Transcript_43528:394-666(+)
MKSGRMPLLHTCTHRSPHTYTLSSPLNPTARNNNNSVNDIQFNSKRNQTKPNFIGNIDELTRLPSDNNNNNNKYPHGSISCMQSSNHSPN